ncbi:MAG: hypothetical protein ABFQ62_05090 [Patescibacteria group bacterium]
MKENNNYQIFKIKDFYQACVLATAKIPLVDLEPGEGKFLTFVFDDKKFMAEEILGQYWDGQLRLDPKELIRNIHEIRNRMYARKNLKNEY